jgi:uncharacterized protein (TIGR03437 family)
MRCRLIFVCLLVSPLFAQQQGVLDTLELTPVASGFDAPTSIVHAGDGSGRLFVSELNGRIWALDSSYQRGQQPFLDIDVRVLSGGERGLLSVAFHPNFETNGRLFVDYTDVSGNTVVSEFRVSTANPGRADPASEQVFFTANQPFANHNGGQLQFGPDGMLYIGMGDGGAGGDPGNRAQSLSSTLGKILRVDVDQGAPARVPPDNPFVGAAGAQGAIWALGLRNPWRFTFDRETGDIWIGDVGQDVWEEVDFGPAGATTGLNYGWRRMEGRHCFNPGSNCETGSLTLPVMEYSHAQAGCSVTGGYRYRGSSHPSLYGVYFFGDFCTGNLFAGVETAPGMFQRLGPRDLGVSISTFGEDELGELYLADFGGGVLYRFGAPPGPPAISQGGVVNAASFAAGRSVAPGSIASVFGVELAHTRASAPAAPLPTTLGGAALTFNDSRPAPLFFVSPGQANLQIPWELAGAETALLAAEADGLQSAAVDVSLTSVQPGIFTMDQSGAGQGAVLISGMGLLAAPTGAFANSRPARTGEFLEVFATGLGPVTNTPASGAESPDDPLAETLLEVRARIGDSQSYPAQFSGLAPGFVGLYQVNIELVGDVPSGPAIPLTLIAGKTESNTVTIAIE